MLFPKRPFHLSMFPFFFRFIPFSSSPRPVWAVWLRTKHLGPRLNSDVGCFLLATVAEMVWVVSWSSRRVKRTGYDLPWRLCLASAETKENSADGQTSRRKKKRDFHQQPTQAIHVFALFHFRLLLNVTQNILLSIWVNFDSRFKIKWFRIYKFINHKFII